MITPMTFQDSLCRFLEKEVAPLHTLKSVDRSGVESLNPPRVYRSGWILPQSIDDEAAGCEKFPYILTRIEKIENLTNERVSAVTVLILFGVYDPGVYDPAGNYIDDGSGYRDFWNLIETTRQRLFEVHTLDRKYMIVDDFFEASMLEQQIYPYWEGFCKTKWYVHFPLPRVEFKDPNIF